MPPVRGACGAGAVVARPGSQGGSRDFLLEEAALWQLPVGDGGGGGGWGKGPLAFIETRRRGAGSAGAGGRRAGAPLPHPGYPTANPSAEAAPGEARGPCAVTAPHCLQQPPSTGVLAWQEALLGPQGCCQRSWAEERRRCPPTGTSCARCPGEWQNPLPRVPQTWLPHLLSSATGTWYWTRFQQPSETPCPALFLAQQRSAPSSRQRSQASCPKLASNLPPSPGIQMSIPVAAPSQMLRPHQLITPPTQSSGLASPQAPESGRSSPANTPQ